MLRMAHRILTEKPSVMAAIHTPAVHSLIWDGHQDVKKHVARAVSVVVDNVAEYYAEHDRQAWDLESDFPSCVPFQSPLLVEWKEPQDPDNSGVTGATACLLTTADLKDYDGFSPEGATDAVSIHCRTLEPYRWVVRAEWYVYVGGVLYCLASKALLAIDHSGRVKGGPCIVGCGGNHDFGKYGEYVRTRLCGTLLHIPLLAMSFASCKNVVRYDTTEQEGPPAKWLKRQKQPKLRYHVLDINPMKEVLRTEGGSEVHGLKKALHICRGHFATYTAEKPLFGNIVGTVWKPAHVRGDIKQGAVVKDYSVSPATP